VQRISFAQALTAAPKTSSNDNLPKPLTRGESVSITITQQIYEKGLEICKINLRGRLVLSKGYKPYTTKDIHLKLQKQWKMTGEWSMRPLGRGFFEFTFASDNDVRMVWATRTVNLKPGLLRLFEWTKDFNMHKKRNTHAQVWIRLMELPQEYWMDRTLREIASVVGTPLIIDNATSKRLYGHYACILVDMDFSRKIFHEITVEREGYTFNVEVAYEWLPDFCSHCQNIGKIPVPTPKPTWVPITDNLSGIGSSLAFARPQQDVPTPTAEVQHLPPPQPVPTAEVHHFPPLQQTVQVPVQHDITFTIDKDQESEYTSSVENVSDDQHDIVIMEEENSDAQLEVDTDINIHVDDNLEQTNDSSLPFQATTVNTSNLSQNSFNMPLENARDEIVCTETTHEVPILMRSEL